MTSVIIPTRNRAHLWKDGRLLASITAQTSRDFELVVCDHGSADDTLEYLTDAARGLSFPLRLFRCSHDTGNADSTIPDQVLFKEAQGGTVLHLDDDGWIGPRAVEFVDALRIHQRQAVYYGRILSVSPETGNVIKDDSRMGHMISKPPPEGHAAIIQIPLTDELRQGAIWAAPTAVLREMGGHDLLHPGYRGCDSRLGHRLGQRLPCFFVAGDILAFWHRGLSLHAAAKAAGKEQESVAKMKVPLYGNCEPLPVVCNGGAKFWESFPIPYERVV